MNTQKNCPNKIDDLYDLTEDILDVKAQDNELIVTDAIGQSMRPTIKTGDRIVIDRAGIGELKTGDIIAFAKGPALICHRIKEINVKDGGRFFKTCGDSHDYMDNFEVELREIAGKVVRVMKRPARSYYFFYLRQSLRAVLRFFGIYELWKEFIYRLIKNRVRMDLSIPRKNNTHPAYRFIDLPLEDVSGRDKEFFAPLDSAGQFRINASFRRSKIAFMEFRKIPEKETAKNGWTVANYWTLPLFSRTGLEPDMLETGRFILDKLDVQFGQKQRFKVRLEYPFALPLRWLLISLQGFPAYRRFAHRSLRRFIRFSQGYGMQKSIRFSALLGKYVVGSVDLIERKNKDVSEWWVYGLHISILLRGLGIGEELMRRLIGSAESVGAKNVHLTVRHDKKAAITLYEKIGFAKVGRDQYGMVIMEKELSI